MVAQDKSVEIETLYQRDDDGFQREVHNDELILTLLSGDDVTMVSASIGAYLGNYVLPNKLGRVTSANGGFILSHEPLVFYVPSTAFVSKERAKPHTGKYYEFAPDLAVEVVSPSDSATYIQEKVQNYLRYGTKVVWVIYPKTRVVEVHKADTVKKLTCDDVIDGGDVLPGFTLPVCDVFAVLEA